MDSRINPQGEYGRFEQILSHFLLKSLHIILNSRVPFLRQYSRRGGEVKKSDKWFNMILGDLPEALDNLSFWRRNLMEPMIIEIILVQNQLNSSSVHDAYANSELGTLKETVIERWVIQYEHLKTMAPLVGDYHYKKIYHKSIILLRSLYSVMRLLPAQKAFQKLLSSSQTCDFDVNYKVSSFSAPFSRAEEELMKQYSFTPVDAQQGKFSISVTYRENLSDFNLETSTIFPSQIITDYVGSPMTDPLRAFPSISSEKRGPIASFSMRGQPSSSSPFQRPHSWTSGVHRPQNQQVSLSPPPYSPYAFSSSPTDTYGHRTQNYRLPTPKKSANNDDFQLSPPSTQSPSPSSPTYLSGGNPVQSRLDSETAPVSIPHVMSGRSPRYLSPNMSDPNRHSLPPLSPKSKRYSPSPSSGLKSLLKSEFPKMEESGSGIINPGQKISRDAKNDSGRFSGLLSSSGSPRIGFSRSSNRLSFPDDLDNGGFACPFIVDDIDAFDSQARNLDGSKASDISLQASSSSTKSQDTAVAALVHLLVKAPPLRQDSSCYSSQASKSEHGLGEEAASDFSISRSTSDALEELMLYKEMKDLLLSKSATRSANKEET